MNWCVSDTWSVVDERTPGIQDRQGRIGEAELVEIIENGLE